MSRARLYVLIDAFEQDMRLAIEGHLLDHIDESDLLNATELSNARLKQAADENGNEVSVIHYLDLQAGYDVLLRNKGSIPTNLAAELSSAAASVSQLVPIRHRVMHGRPLNADDPAKTVTLLSPFSGAFWTQTQTILGRLRQDSSWEPYFEGTVPGDERIVHNLPAADYDETSFIGRRDESSWLLGALRQRRNRIITVTGEGGIGKTALALDVAYKLVDSDDNPYEAILWVSLKTEKLTASGVEELRDAIRGIDETIGVLGRGLTTDFSGSISELAEALLGIDCLIIIDNLESANGDEIVHLHDELPDTVRFLFTSRIGIGQLERRYPLSPLGVNEAVLLLRKFASSRRQKRLASLAQEAAETIVSELRSSPLAIRWYVLASESGQVPADVLRNQRELLNFCVQNVYESLREDSKAVLTVLRALDRRIGFDEFAVLTDLSIDELRTVTQELTRGSLVAVESMAVGQAGSSLALTPTARSFLKRPDHTGTFIAEVLRREREYLQLLESKRMVSSAVDPRNIHERTPEDRPTIYLLRSATKLAASGRSLDQVTEIIERARSFNPDFSEVHRVSGDVHSRFGRLESAVADYQVALTYATADSATAIASFQLAIVFGRKLHNAILALPHAEKAYALAPCYDTAALLGRVRIWTGDFLGGQILLENLVETSTGFERVAAVTALTDGWARWGEAHFKDHKYVKAFENAMSGFHTGAQFLKEALKDERLSAAIAECCIIALRALDRDNRHRDETLNKDLEKMASFMKTSGQLIPAKKRGLLYEALTTALWRMDTSTPIYAKLYAGYEAVEVTASTRAPR
ncbi:NB-ARC domain-containing protein [Arthrobacter sp. MDT3-24]